MKGVLLVIIMIGVLVVSLLVVKNISKHQTLQGDSAQIEAIDRAKEAAELINKKTEEMQRQLEKAMQP